MKYRLLIVDDEHLLRMTLEGGMSDLGYEVRTAETIGEALRITEEFRPDAVLLDNRLKGETVYHKCFGCADIETGASMTFETVCHVASVSKQFTVMAGMLLQEEGRFDYDADLRIFDVYLRRIGQEDLKYYIQFGEQAFSRSCFFVKPSAGKMSVTTGLEGSVLLSTTR